MQNLYRSFCHCVSSASVTTGPASNESSCASPLCSLLPPHPSGQSLWVRFWALTCCGPLSGVSDRSGHHLQQRGAVARPLPASSVWLHGPHVATTPPVLGVQTGQPGAAGRHLRHLGPIGGTSRTLSLCRSQCSLAGQHQHGQKQLPKVSLLEDPVMSAADSPVPPSPTETEGAPCVRKE